MADFLREYWDEIVALFDKIYAAIRDYVLDKEAEEDAE